MSQVKVIGIADLRGKKKKDGSVMQYAVFHVMLPMKPYEGNIGYECQSIFVPARLLDGVPLKAPGDYEITKDFATNNVDSVTYIGKD